MFGLIWIPTGYHSGDVPERFFLKVNFEKKSADDKKKLQNHPACKELTEVLFHLPVLFNNSVTVSLRGLQCPYLL